MTEIESVDQTLVKNPLTYKSSLFVNRYKEESFIRGKIDDIRFHKKTPGSIVNLWGAGGIGKTWILHHIADLYNYHSSLTADASHQPPTFTLLYTFSEDPNSALPEALARQLAQHALLELKDAALNGERTLLEQAARNGDLDALVKAIEQLERFVPIIMLDDAEKVQRENWQKLEPSFIQPLAITGRVLFLIAGRRRVPRWRRFDVRRCTEDSNKTQLHAFDREDVKRQIEQRGYPVDVNTLYPYTAGNPHLVDVIGIHIQRWAQGERPDQAWFEARRAQLSEILGLYEEQLLHSVQEEALHQCLHAVAPLRFYRLEALLSMLDQRDQPIGYYVNTLDQLDRQTEVVWWSSKARAYVTDEMVRRVINTHLLLRDQRRYVHQHQRALKMYELWVSDYPDASEDFILEIWFHLVSIYLADRDDTSLHNGIKKYLDIACQTLRYDGLFMIARQLEKEGQSPTLQPEPEDRQEHEESDDELIDLLPQSICLELRQEIDKAKKEKAEQLL